MRMSTCALCSILGKSYSALIKSRRLPLGFDTGRAWLCRTGHLDLAARSSASRSMVARRLPRFEALSLLCSHQTNAAPNTQAATPTMPRRNSNVSSSCCSMSAAISSALDSPCSHTQPHSATLSHNQAQHRQARQPYLCLAAEGQGLQALEAAHESVTSAVVRLTNPSTTIRCFAIPPRPRRKLYKPQLNEHELN